MEFFVGYRRNYQNDELEPIVNAPSLTKYNETQLRLSRFNYILNYKIINTKI